MPVLLLGGDANALSVARSLKRQGIKVYAVGDPDSTVRASRASRWIDLGHVVDAERAWADFLLGRASDFLRGALVLACSDAGIQVLSRHREALSARFRLDECNPTAQLALLDKVGTYRLSVAAGVPTPKFWVVESFAELESIRASLVFPLIVKPRLIHRSNRSFKSKHTYVRDWPELTAALKADWAAGVDVLLMEWIPGGDDALCSYYTYLDAAGKAHFHFTKRVIRRYPAGMGLGCYHVTDWIPELVEQSLRLFRAAGLRGLANVEYKRDPRDGQYKLIECNARFTAANALVDASGIDLAGFVYRRAAGLPQRPMNRFRRGLRLLDPLIDVMAFLERRTKGELTVTQWIASLTHRQVFPFFSWADLGPALARGKKMLKVLKKSRTAPPRAAAATERVHPTSMESIPAAASSALPQMS